MTPLAGHQLVFYKKVVVMWNKDKPFLSKKLLLICSATIILVLLALFLHPLLKILIGDIYGFFDFLTNNQELWNNLGILSLLFIAILLLFCIALPIAIYAVKIISAYFSLFNICIAKNYKIKINKIALLPLKPSDPDGEITVKTREGTLCLHFINLLFTYHRAITISNSQEYVITPLVQKQLSKQGQGIGGANMSSGNGHRNALIRSTKYDLSNNRDKSNPLPEISGDDRKKHILLIPNMPSEARCAINNISMPLSSGQKIGNFTFYSLSHLKKGLKNKLHTSIIY